MSDRSTTSTTGTDSNFEPYSNNNCNCFFQFEVIKQLKKINRTFQSIDATLNKLVSASDNSERITNEELTTIVEPRLNRLKDVVPDTGTPENK